LVVPAVEHLEKLGGRILVAELVKLLDGHCQRRIGLDLLRLLRLSADFLGLAGVGLRRRGRRILRLLLFRLWLFLRAAAGALLLLLLLLLVLLGLLLRLLLGRRLGGLLEQFLKVIAEPAPIGRLRIELFTGVDPRLGVAHRTGRHRLPGTQQPPSPRDSLLRQGGEVAGGELRLRGEAFDETAERRGVGRGVLSGETGNLKPETG